MLVTMVYYARLEAVIIEALTLCNAYIDQCTILTVYHTSDWITPEGFVERAIPADEGARNKEDEVHNGKGERYPWWRRGSVAFHTGYKIRHWTNDVQKQDHRIRCKSHTHTHTHTQTYTHTLCPGLPGWAGNRRDIHPLTPESFCESLSSFWILWGVEKITEASALTIRLDATPSRPSMPPPPSSPQFYAKCPSCRNPPNLSWLGTGTKYAGLYTMHTCTAKYVSAVSRFFRAWKDWAQFI